MQLLRSTQAPPLSEWQGRPFSATVVDGPRAADYRDTHERVIATEPPGEPLLDGPHRRVAARILSYDIFPPSVGRSALARSPVEVGDTVGLRYRLWLGHEIFFASRVIELFDEPRGEVWRSGFTYRTLAGHPMLGEETVSVEKNRTSGEVLVALRAWSRPGGPLTKLAKPIARRWQLRAGRAALDHLQSLANASLA